MYNTGNAVPSTDVKDLYDNTQTEDVFVNGETFSVTTRTGKLIRTLAGMNNAFDQLLEKSGFESLHLVYTPGSPLAVQRQTQLIDYSGSVYRVKVPAQFPVQLSGNWAVDSPKLVDVSDAALRQALSTQGVQIIANSATVVETAVAMLALPKSSMSKRVTTLGRLVVGDQGAASYYRDDSDTTTPSDGWTVLVANDGARYKLVFDKELHSAQSGLAQGADISQLLNSMGEILYSRGGGVIYVVGSYKLAAPCRMYPQVKILSAGSGRLNRLTSTHSGTAFTTYRPAGYVPLCIGAQVKGFTLVGPGFQNGTCFELIDCMQCEVEGNEIALFNINCHWNKGSTATVVHQAFFNKFSQNIVKPCYIAHYFDGAANRNTFDTNSYADCQVAYDFSAPFNYSETNTFITENVEGCRVWAEWGAAVYSQTWVNLCIENPTNNGFVCLVKDPGRQVFVNLSLIPLGNSAAIAKYDLTPGKTSMVLGSAASSGDNRLGFVIPEEFKLYNVQTHFTHHASGVFSGDVPAGGIASINIPLATAKLNDRVDAYGLRSLLGCTLQAFASAGNVTVVIANGGASPVTISNVEISVILKRVG